MKGWLRENRKYVVGIGALALIAFLGLHDLYNYLMWTGLQRTMNYMSAHAFQSWLHEIESAKSILEVAETNFDVKEAMNTTFAAKQFASILTWQIEVYRPPDFVEHLHLRIAGAAIGLHRAVSGIATKPPITLRNLDDDTLQRIENLTITIESLIESVGTVRRGVDPTQQLEEKGVLSQVIDYCKQMQTTSYEIWAMYDYYG